MLYPAVRPLVNVDQVVPSVELSNVALSPPATYCVPSQITVRKELLVPEAGFIQLLKSVDSAMLPFKPTKTRFPGVLAPAAA